MTTKQKMNQVFDKTPNQQQWNAQIVQGFQTERTSLVVAI